MNVKQHIRMTASEIAMGRYMRAPEHPPADDEFAKAFDSEVLTSAAEGGGDGPVVDDGDGGGAAPPAASGDGGSAAVPAGDGTGAAAGGEGQAAADDKGAAQAEGGAAPAAGAEADDKGAAPAAGGKAGDASEADAGAGADPAGGGAAGKDGAAAAAVPDGADADAILDRLADAVAKRKPAAAEAPAAEAPAAETPPLFTETEQATLAKFKEDWPVEHQAVELMQRELGVGITQYVFGQMAPVVKEIKDLVQTLAVRAAHGDIVTDLGEYPSDQEIDQIKDWVKTQPSYLQSGMNGVIDGGTPDEIIDLVSRYREATGQKPAGEQAPEPKPSGGDTELSGAAKQAAEALAPVGSKRSVVQNPDDTSDFDASWAKFADMKV